MKQTTSTNDETLQLAKEGAPEWTTVFSEAQTKGRGRLGRVWFSDPGNLYASVILRPQIKPAAAPLLTYVAALALYDTVQSLGEFSVTLKWPNDVRINDKKVAGILNQLQTQGGTLESVIIGVGLNINQTTFPKEIEDIAISLKQVTGKDYVIQECLDQFLSHLGSWYARYLKEGFSPIRQVWEERSQMCGKEVVVDDGKQKIKGKAKGLSDQGALILTDPAGTLITVFSGDVISCR